MNFASCFRTTVALCMLLTFAYTYYSLGLPTILAPIVSLPVGVLIGSKDPNEPMFRK